MTSPGPATARLTPSSLASAIRHACPFAWPVPVSTGEHYKRDETDPGHDNEHLVRPESMDRLFDLARHQKRQDRKRRHEQPRAKLSEDRSARRRRGRRGRGRGRQRGPPRARRRGARPTRRRRPRGGVRGTNRAGSPASAGARKTPSGTSVWKCGVSGKADPNRCTKVIAPGRARRAGTPAARARSGLHG